MSAVCVFTNNAHKNISGNVVFTETKRGLQIKIKLVEEERNILKWRFVEEFLSDDEDDYSEDEEDYDF